MSKPTFYVTHDAAGAERYADPGVSDGQAMCRSAATEGRGLVCARVFGVYGHRKTDFRCSLGNGHYRVYSVKRGAVSALPIRRIVYGRKEREQQPGERKWSSMKNCRN